MAPPASDLRSLFIDKAIEVTEESAVWIIFVAEVCQSFPVFGQKGTGGVGWLFHRVGFANILPTVKWSEIGNQRIVPLGICLVFTGALPLAPWSSIDAGGHGEGSVGQSWREHRSGEVYQ